MSDTKQQMVSPIFNKRLPSLVRAFQAFKGVAVGVDGCKAGWLAVINQRGQLSYQVASSLEHLVLSLAPESKVFIDMPIGLLTQGESHRECDRLARQSLAPARSGSIFPVPCRQAVYASDYLAACDINQAITGKRLSKQSWFICHKMAQLDRLLVTHPSLVGRVLESHPELCFKGLDGAALAHNKKTAAGLAQRLSLLAPFDKQDLVAEIVANTQRKAVLKDDIVDAFVLMVSATLSQYCQAYPDVSHQGSITDMYDEQGLPRQIHFLAPPAE